MEWNSFCLGILMLCVLNMLILGCCSITKLMCYSSAPTTTAVHQLKILLKFRDPWPHYRHHTTGNVSNIHDPKKFSLKGFPHYIGFTRLDFCDLWLIRLKNKTWFLWMFSLHILHKNKILLSSVLCNVKVKWSVRPS